MIQSQGALMLSDTTPTFARSTYYPQVGLDLSARFASYNAIYRAQLMVYALVNKLAYNTARLPLKVYRRSTEGRTEERDSAYARLLRNPNPNHDPFFFWMWTVSTFNVYGEALWAKIRGRDGLPAELWPLHPANVYTRRAGENDANPGELIYVFTLGLGQTPQLEIPARDIVHFKAYNPDSTLRGLSALEPLRLTLLNEDASRRATAAFWNNGARPSVVLSHPGKLSQPAADRLAASWAALHGGVDNFAKTAVLEEGMKPEVLSLSAEEAQYIESRKLGREEVCIAYDMPPPAMHILDHATFSNITEQMRSVYRDTMAPRLGLLESVMDSSLRPEFDATGDLYAEFLMDEVMRGSFEARTEAQAKAVQFGLLTAAEGREMENRPYLEGADRLFINSTLIPIDASSVNAVGALVRAGFDPASSLAALGLPPIAHTGLVPVTVQGEDAAVAVAPGASSTPKSLSTAQVRSVLGRLGRYATLVDIDPERLVAGLNGETETVLAALAASDSIDDLRVRIKSLEGAQ